MSQITQDNHIMSISDFSLGKDTFLLTSFQGDEHISKLFNFHIEVLSENHDVSADDVVGKSGTITIQNEHKRKFNGYISQFWEGEPEANNLRRYKMTMVPWLWFLQKTNNHRIFQEKNTKDIVSQVFSDLGFNDFDFKASGGEKREYCIQHNESDFDFVSRLLEEEGIAYYFKHQDGKHMLQLVDKKNAYEVCDETDLDYSQGQNPNSQITSWERIHEFRKGQWSLNDYNFKEPTNSLLAGEKTTSKFAKNKNFEHYEYPGLYKAGIGSNLVKVRLDAEEVQRDTAEGASNCSSFYAGGRFNVKRHSHKNEKGEYILTDVHHSATDESYYNDDNPTVAYSNFFACIPSSVHFRPLLEHKRPVMRGPQSAVVVGPSGEEIYVDEFGRIKVQFIWDREGKKDENSSCWIRVSQSWAGNQWGASFIPRIGHEVIVSFMDGDPDRPIVTGCVYNGKNKPPYTSKTQSGIKTRSTKGGNAQNYNELRFDDKKDSEQIYIHAEKNMDTQIENDETLTVDNDRTKHVKHDENSTIDNNRNKTVGKNQSENIGDNKTISVGKNHSESIGKNSTIDVGENHTESVGKNVNYSVGKNIDISIAENHSESVGKNMTITVDKDLDETVKGKYTEDVTKEYGLKAKSITMQADDQITLKTGSAKIVMKKNGDITISGKNINVKGSGNVVLKGSKVTQN
ncbi:type VI secretion system tip protein VgrG [Aliikangiella marina]|uniref:Type VI secretion system tip protein VgrG n=1 Tax=Aliikangiella marina TaxID=1712262 RepID=A0A545TGN2_9GAMM|nr:type VI secretion system tip protein TssI/VgrG [Aliikangiella marina]TQV76392.1 type VI secretion system tip protein VgrG [Aliikangiella marina]